MLKEKKDFLSPTGWRAVSGVSILVALILDSALNGSTGYPLWANIPLSVWGWGGLGWITGSWIQNA